MSMVSSLMFSEMFELLSDGSRRRAASIFARSSSAPGWTGLSAPALALGAAASGFGAGAGVFVAPAEDSGLSMSVAGTVVRGCGCVGVVGACCGFVRGWAGGVCAFCVPVFAGFVAEGCGVVPIWPGFSCATAQAAVNARPKAREQKKFDRCIRTPGVDEDRRIS